MRIDRNTFVRWMAWVAIFHVAGLLVWHALSPAYLQLVRGALVAGRAVGLLPAGTRFILVPGHGLALAAAWLEPLAVDQHVLETDLALAGALMLATPCLTWPVRMRRALPALTLVFLAHVTTIAAQASVHSTLSLAASSAWTLWVTLYQGKVVPIAAWLLTTQMSRVNTD